MKELFLTSAVSILQLEQLNLQMQSKCHKLVCFIQKLVGWATTWKDIKSTLLSAMRFKPQVILTYQWYLKLSLTFVGRIIKFECGWHPYLEGLQPGNDPLLVREIQAQP